MHFIKMSYPFSILLIFPLLLSSCAINDKHQLNNFLNSSKAMLGGLNKKSLTEKDIAAGLKEALKVGSERVVARLRKRNAYFNDKAIHIRLPAKLQKVHKTLNKVGLCKYTKELEVKMNRAAEIAAPKAKKLFLSAIKSMRWRDVRSIYNGKNDAATQYFKKKMTPALRRMMRPVIKKTLSDVGFVKIYKKAIHKYHAIPFVPRVKDDMVGYVINKAIVGMFYYLAKEESLIRKDPAKRTTELLRRVFS